MFHPVILATLLTFTSIFNPIDKLNSYRHSEDKPSGIELIKKALGEEQDVKITENQPNVPMAAIDLENPYYSDPNKHFDFNKADLDDRFADYINMEKDQLDGEKRGNLFVVGDTALEIFGIIVFIPLFTVLYALLRRSVYSRLARKKIEI